MNVQLYDLKFPLLGREMSIDDFERVIKDNPSNSHLYKFKEVEKKEIVSNEFNENYKLSNNQSYQ